MDTMAICPGLMTDKIRSDLFVQPQRFQAAHNWHEVGLNLISSEYEHILL